MAYNKKTWLARLGQGLNKFILNGGSKVTLESSPDTVTQQGTPLSAENMNDLEQRIADEFSNQTDAINAIISDVTLHKKTENLSLNNLSWTLSASGKYWVLYTPTTPMKTLISACLNEFGDLRATDMLTVGASTSSNKVMITSNTNSFVSGAYIELGLVYLT